MYGAGYEGGTTLLKYLAAKALGHHAGGMALCTQLQKLFHSVGWWAEPARYSTVLARIAADGGIIVYFRDNEVPRWPHLESC